MNGQPPPSQTMHAPQPPPSVQQARRQMAPRRPWTGLWRGRILGVVVALAVLAVIVAQLVVRTQSAAPRVTPADVTLDPPWGPKKPQYEPDTPGPAPPLTPPVDTLTPELARLRGELGGLRGELTGLKNELNELKNRKVPTGGSGTGSGAQAAPLPTATMAPTLFVSHAPPEEKGTPKPTQPEYVLAPGTYLTCGVMPLMNSDVPGMFTLQITQNIYDTKTGGHLLVPQHALVLGHDHGQTLLYGNERLPTVAMTLTISDASSVGEPRTYDLGQVPVTDQLGTNGLTGEVDNHFWRLVGAVFIGGALRGGQQAMQTAIADAGGAGQVASGIASVASQVGQHRVGRALDTRPTIRVFAGQGCKVLLTKPLTLPSVWQGDAAAPVTAVSTRR
jgi:type IV secretory pathway VirB10-like protein